MLLSFLLLFLHFSLRATAGPISLKTKAHVINILILLLSVVI